jgi:AbrB family looped-hinge helix DNA binding protein
MTKTKSVRLSSKGQLVIPKEMREALGVKEGDPLLAVLEEGRIVLSRPATFSRTTRGALKGTWGRDAQAIARYLQGERQSWR